MKYFIYILLTLAIALMIYNGTLIDFSNPLQGDSKTAVIGVLAPLCVVVLLIILLLSRTIQQKVKKAKIRS